MSAAIADIRWSGEFPAGLFLIRDAGNNTFSAELTGATGTIGTGVAEMVVQSFCNSRAMVLKDKEESRECSIIKRLFKSKCFCFSDIINTSNRERQPDRATDRLYRRFSEIVNSITEFRIGKFHI